jgi:hypothetical protein
MDWLDQLGGAGADLLGRVDGSLAESGAPEDHRIWPLLRRLRTLPGEAAGALATLRPAPLTDAGVALRGLIRDYDDARAILAEGGSWQGAGADAFAAHRAGLAAYLGGDPQSLTGRLVATAGYADALAGWVTDSRAALARTLAEVLGSAEAVTVVTGTASTAGSSDALAAAEIGARVLATVADAYDHAEALGQQWAPSLVELSYRPSAEPPTPLDGTIRLGR